MNSISKIKTSNCSNNVINQLSELGNARPTQLDAPKTMVTRRGARKAENPNLKRYYQKIREPKKHINTNFLKIVFFYFFKNIENLQIS